ncbi:MAG: HypC/HybG/HupF family hydrogenase formation chaperone [bacterium]
MIVCLAIPAKVLYIDGDIATCELANVKVRTDISFVEGVVVGSWVLVHAGVAIAVLTENEAMETFEILSEVFGKDKE